MVQAMHALRRREANMRFPVCGLLFAAIASPAIAGDNSLLRGSTTDFPMPQPHAPWSGLYGGGQMSADFHGVRFLDNGTSLIGAALANATSANDQILRAVPAPGMPD